MAMARDGLLPSFFSDVNKQTQVPVKSTIVTGIFAAALAFAMDVSQLAGMVSNQLSVIVCIIIAFFTMDYGRETSRRTVHACKHYKSCKVE
jgi:amino acid transporter